MDYDVFVCHASEDKDFVEPLAKALRDKGLSVWYDRFEFKIGDSLRRKIDHGLANSRYGIVVLSEAFFTKNWPQSELDALASRQNEEGRKVILPIWYKIDAGEIKKHSPLLASLYAARSGDGLDIVVGQILSVFFDPDESQRRSVFQASGDLGLRESCLEVIRQGDQSAWVKLVDKLQAPIDNQLLEWKKDGEEAIGKGPEVWRDAVVKATEICLPGFVPMFSAVEAGQKEQWKDATRILRRLALLENKMGSGTPDVLRIGLRMMYVAGSIGIAIAAQTGQLDYVWDWMRLDMPNSLHSGKRKWAEIRTIFWPPFGIDYRNPFQFLLGFNSNEHVKGFFKDNEQMRESLFKANLLQSIVELRLLTRTQEGLLVVKEHNTKYKCDVKVVPFWCLINQSDFETWVWDLFMSSDDLLSFFLMDSTTKTAPERLWCWWKGWKIICEACIDEIMGHRISLRTEWLMLPGEPADNG